MAVGGEQLVHENEAMISDDFDERYGNISLQYNMGQARLYEDEATIGLSYNGIGNGGTDSARKLHVK